MTLSCLESSVCVGTLAYVCVFWVCVCMAACVSLRISACVFQHNDIVLCYGVEELLNLELSLTMTSSIMLMQNVCLSVMGPSTLLQFHVAFC